MTQEELTALITTLVARAPQWVRHDLLSTDASLRARAEETLAAMVAAGIVTDIPGVIPNAA
jgi:hypothetical protein